MARRIEPVEAENVLHALVRIEQSIQGWKDAVQSATGSGTTSISIAQGPFDPVSVPGPPPPFSGCSPEFAAGPPPLEGCGDFDIDVYVQQVSGFFLGLYHGLVFDQGGDGSS